MSNPGPGSNYVINSDIVVNQGDTLKIEPGVAIHFDDRNDDLFVLGTLLADGNLQDSIKFLGFENPNLSSSSHGGHIEFRASSENSSISYALIDKLGDTSGSSGGYALELQSTGVEVANTQITNSENIGLYIIENISPEVHECAFENNQKDISIHPEGATNILIMPIRKCICDQVPLINIQNFQIRVLGLIMSWKEM